MFGSLINPNHSIKCMVLGDYEYSVVYMACPQMEGSYLGRGLSHDKHAHTMTHIPLMPPHTSGRVHAHRGEGGAKVVQMCAHVTVCLLTNGILLFSFYCRTHLLFSMCLYDWVHCLILLDSSNSAFIEL